MWLYTLLNPSTLMMESNWHISFLLCWAIAAYSHTGVTMDKSWESISISKLPLTITLLTITGCLFSVYTVCIDLQSSCFPYNGWALVLFLIRPSFSCVITRSLSVAEFLSLCTVYKLLLNLSLGICSYLLTVHGWLVLLDSSSLWLEPNSPWIYIWPWEYTICLELSSVCS